MKKIVLKHLSILSYCLLIVAIGSAQNVGINEPAPTAKLTVKGTEATADGQAAAIKIQNTAGNTNAWYLRAGGTGNNTPNGGFSIADNSGYHFIMGQGGNIGLGIAPSTVKLDVNGAMKIRGGNTLEFGAGVSGKETNAGKIGYQAFTPGALDIVGAGTLVSNRKVNIFAEGGTTFNGPINVGGSTGTAGQVLTSNGTAAPTWENAAYSNNIRFAVNFRNIPTNSPNDYAEIYITKYNLNPTEIVISPTGITINRSGLYHFDLEAIASIAFATAQTSRPAFGCWLFTSPSGAFNLIENELMQPQNTATNNQFLANGTESLEVYITAPVTLRVYHTICICGSTFYNVSGYLTGHLISE